MAAGFHDVYSDKSRKAEYRESSVILLYNVVSLILLDTI